MKRCAALAAAVCSLSLLALSACGIKGAPRAPIVEAAPPPPAPAAVSQDNPAAVNVDREPVPPVGTDGGCQGCRDVQQGL